MPMLQRLSKESPAVISHANEHGSRPWSLDQGPALFHTLLPRLPPPIQQTAHAVMRSAGRESGNLWVEAAQQARTRTASLVRSSSLRQAALGLVSANLATSVSYVWAKIVKRFGG